MAWHFILTMTNLLDVFCDHIVGVVSHVDRLQNGWHIVFVVRKDIVIHSNVIINIKHLANQSEYSKYPLPAFAHAFSLLVKFLTAKLLIL